MVETQAAIRIYPFLGLVFCLVRMYRQGDTVCYVTEKGLVVRSHYRTFYEFMSEILFGTEHLVFIPYKIIFDIPSNWVTFELGSTEIGGLVVQPVRLRYLSEKNKNRNKILLCVMLDNRRKQICHSGENKIGRASCRERV